MANLQNDESDTPAQPARLANNSTPTERAAANRQHHKELVGHTLDASDYGGHGHALGKAGPGRTGHDMPDNDLHLQSGAYIPRGAFAKIPQSTTSDGAGAVDKG